MNHGYHFLNSINHCFPKHSFCALEGRIVMRRNKVYLLPILKKKNVTVTELPDEGPMLRKKWEEAFANHLSEREKRAIYLHDRGGACGFLWHVFSYEKRECLTEKEADEAFNKQEKDTCYIYYQDDDDALLIENASAVTANDFFHEYDVYVVDKEFTWTYVRTHETGWFGPYFCKR